MFFRRIIFLFLFIAVLNNKIFSTEMSDSVSTGIKDFKLFEDNADIESLKKENYEDIDDLLSVYPGIDLTNLGYPGQFMSFSYRGLSQKSVSISIDGIPVESNISGLSDLNLVPVEIMDRVYFTNYSVFNPSYLNIDFQTKLILNKQPFTRVIYRIGDYERSFTDIFFKRNLSKLSDLAFAGNFEKYPGQFGNDNYFRRRFWISYKRRLSKNIDLKFSGTYLKRGVDLPSDIPVSKKLVSRNSREDNNSRLYNLSLNRNKENSNINVYLYFNGYKRTYKAYSEIKDKENIYGSGFSYKKILNNGILNAAVNFSVYSIDGNSFPKYENENKISTFLNYRYIFSERFIINPYLSIYN